MISQSFTIVLLSLLCGALFAGQQFHEAAARGGEPADNHERCHGDPDGHRRRLAEGSRPGSRE